MLLRPTVRLTARYRSGNQMGHANGLWNHASDGRQLDDFSELIPFESHARCEQGFVTGWYLPESMSNDERIPFAPVAEMLHQGGFDLNQIWLVSSHCENRDAESGVQGLDIDDIESSDSDSVY